MRAPRTLLRFLRKYDSNAALVDSSHPRPPGFHYLNEGCETRAFRYGAYVVKKHTKVGRPFPRAAARALGVHPPQEWMVNGWVVQPFYRRFRWPYTAKWAQALWDSPEDFGSHNIGKDARGRLVAFDW